MRRIPEIREKVNDRAVLRGIHSLPTTSACLKKQRRSEAEILKSSKGL